MHDRHRAHRARFQGHVQGAAEQAMVGQQLATGPHGHDLGMRTGVVRGDVEVPALAQQLAIGAHQYRTDRDLVELALRARSASASAWRIQCSSASCTGTPRASVMAVLACLQGQDGRRGRIVRPRPCRRR
jgi:hypothetical protein